MEPEKQEAAKALARGTGSILGFAMMPMFFVLIFPLVWSLFKGYWLGVAGSLLSAISFVLYPMAMYRGRSVSGMLLAISGIIPYLFSLYVMGFFGVYRLYLFTERFRFDELVFGMFWLGVGYILLHKFWLYTELVARAGQVRKKVLGAEPDLANQEKRQNRIIRYTDSRTQCWSRVDLVNGEPIWISVTPASINVKKSNLGIMGRSFMLRGAVLRSRPRQRL